jgi:photosystem II stability/assembly factor-like uncharacterized protein
MISLLLVALAMAVTSDEREAASPNAVHAVVAPRIASPDARAYGWRPVAIGGGGFVTGLSADRTGRTRVTRADVYGAYLWNAEKSRWTQLVTASSMPEADRKPMTLSQGVYEVVVAPSDPRRIYMAIAGGLYRSEDGGAHFAKTSLPPVAFDANGPFRHSGPFIAVAPANPELVLFGTPANGLWRSADGGRNWARVESVPTPAKANDRSPGIVVWFRSNGGGDAGEVWAMSPGAGVFRSSDGGSSFSPLTSGGAHPTILRQGAFGKDGAFYGVDHDAKKVWKFADGAWSDLAGAPGLTPAPFATVAIDPRDGAIYVFDEGGRGFRSANGGARWSRMAGRSRVGPGGEPPWLRVSDKGYFATAQVYFDPQVPGRLWNAAGTGPYYADLQPGSAKIEWNSQARGIEELVANDVVAPPGRLPLFAAWDFGVHLRDDLTRFSTGYGPKERVLIAVQQVDWSASNPSFLVTNASDTLKCCWQDGDAVMAGYSQDGGRTWSKFPSLPTPPGTSASDPWRMSYGTIAVSAKDVNNIVWEPANNRSPFYTVDRGKTWSRVVLPGERLPNTGSYGSYYFHRRTLTSDRVLPGTFYLMHSGDGDNAALAGLWVTHDGGRKWSRVFRGEIAPNSGASAKLRAVPGKAGHLFFTADVGGPDSALRRSVDGGRTWMVLKDVTHAHDIALGKAAPGKRYPTLYVAAYVKGVYGFWRSIDEGGSWTRIGEFPTGSLDEVVVMDADKDVFGRVYAGFKGSGWVFGQPETCAPSAYRPGDDRECFSLTPPKDR